MEWHDEGIILGTRKHGETSAILEVMTRAHGRHLGLVRGGRSRKQQPVLQPGNRVSLSWRARLDEHLGMFQAEPLAFNAARLFDSAMAIYGLQTLAAHLRLLPERDPHAALYETLGIVIDHLGDPASAAELVVRFELLVLDELGFGLDLSRMRRDRAARRSRLCLAENRAGGVARGGRALARQDAGAAGLPQARRDGGADRAGIEEAFRLTGFFFARHVYEPRGIAEPEARAGFLGALAQGIRRSRRHGETAA